MAITAKLQAGLGNQLFIYGTALAMARRLGATLNLDTSLFCFDTRRHFELDFFDTGATEVTGRFRNRSGRRQDTSNLPAKFAQYLTIKKLARDPKVLMETTKTFDQRVNTWGDGTKLLGYFQSWRYLEPVKEELRRRIIPAAHLDKKALSWVLDQRAFIDDLNDPVIVHLRRGDYLLPAHRDFHGVLGLSYYRRALATLSAGRGYGEVVVVSDDLPAARSMFSEFSAIFIDQPPELADSATLLAVSGSQKFVIANSSFSWWWAWLSAASDVVAPKNWFAREDLDASDVCPPSWQLV